MVQGWVTLLSDADSQLPSESQDAIVPFQKVLPWVWGGLNHAEKETSRAMDAKGEGGGFEAESWAE